MATVFTRSHLNQVIIEKKATGWSAPVAFKLRTQKMLTINRRTPKRHFTSAYIGERLPVEKHSDFHHKVRHSFR